MFLPQQHQLRCCFSLIPLEKVLRQTEAWEGDGSCWGFQEEPTEGKQCWSLTSVEDWEGASEEGWLTPGLQELKENQDKER